MRYVASMSKEKHDLSVKRLSDWTERQEVLLPVNLIHNKIWERKKFQLCVE